VDKSGGEIFLEKIFLKKKRSIVRIYSIHGKRCVRLWKESYLRHTFARRAVLGNVEDDKEREFIFH